MKMIHFKIENAAKALRNPKVVLAALVMNFVISLPLAALFALRFFHGQNPYLTKRYRPSMMIFAWFRKIY